MLGLGILQIEYPGGVVEVAGVKEFIKIIFPVSIPYCTITTQKMKFSIKDFFSKCDQIHSFQRI